MADTPSFNKPTVRLILKLPNGQELEHKSVPESETLWRILLEFQSKFNQNLCKKFNKDNRFELPQLLYNNFPFASTLQQLLSTKLSDITKNRRSSKDPVKLVVIFKPQAFSINELDTKISKLEKQLKSSEKSEATSMDVDDKELKSNDDDNKKSSGLPEDFAMDVDEQQALTKDEIYRKMEMELYKLCKLLTTKEAFKSCTKYLKMIPSNLIKYPLTGSSPNNDGKDPTKFRKVNMEHPKLSKALFQYPPALELLKLIGFTKQSGTSNLIMPPQNEDMTVFQALIVKVGQQVPPKDAPPTVELEAKIYQLEDLRQFRLSEARIMAEQAANKSNSSDASLSSQHRRAIQNAQRMKNPDKLMGSKMRNEMYGVKQKDYPFTVIRIEFPSKYVLEGKFHPETAIFKLFEFVTSFLDDQVLKLKWQLLLPPHQVIKNKNQDTQTFKTEGGMIPACTIRFILNPKKNKNTTYNGKYIRNEFLEKYLTKQITSLRSPTSNNNNVENKNDEQKNDGNNNNNGGQKKKPTKEELKAIMKLKRDQEKRRRQLEALNNKLQQ